jgi:hypothetical protein
VPVRGGDDRTAGADGDLGAAAGDVLYPGGGAVAGGDDQRGGGLAGAGTGAMLADATTVLGYFLGVAAVIGGAIALLAAVLAWLCWPWPGRADDDAGGGRR